MKTCWKWVIGGAACAVVTIIGFAVGYVHGVGDGIGLPCPNNCKCAGDCVFL